MKKGVFFGVNKTCPCGAEFYSQKHRSERAKYCSTECKYKFMKRPSGLVYKIVAKNKGWFPIGFTGGHRYPKGYIPANFKGQNVGYAALHNWVYQHRGPPLECEQCGSRQRLQWANKSWEYHRDLADWLALCYQCHRRYDMNGPGWGNATEKYPELQKTKRLNRVKQQTVLV